MPKESEQAKMERKLAIEQAKIERQLAIEQAKVERKLANERARAKRNKDKAWLDEIKEPELLSEDYIYRLVVTGCVNHFKLSERVPPFHLCDIGGQDLDWQHSPGSPWTDLGFNTRAEVISDKDSLQSIRRVWHLLKEGEDINLPHSTFVRGALEYPFTVYIQEACYAVPLMEAYSTSDIAMTCHLDNVCDSCCKLFYGSSSPNIKNIPPWLIRTVFDILCMNADLTKYQVKGFPNTEKLCHGVWIGLIKYFINTPIRTQSGQIIHKTKGVPSGSAFAKLIITIVNFIVATYCKLKYETQITEAFNQNLYLQNVGNRSESIQRNQKEKKSLKVKKQHGKHVIGTS